MPGALVIVLLSLVVAACGGGSSTDGGVGAGGAGASGAAPGIEAPVVVGELPGVGNVLFGTAWDPATLGVTGATKTVKQGTAPLVAVGRSLARTDPSGVLVQIGQGGAEEKPRAIDASDKTEGAQLFAVDVAKDNLAPGTWIVTFLSKDRQTLASGYLVVQP